ncbi:MAG TPA: ABC transporter ATP-binding protein [Gemmatimonadaceae bacterium]|nr:ABC transporter ATP-binding protein [Gemmatimonadaceae bacterium]
MLRAAGLTKRYAPSAPLALDALDLEVRDGELLFLLGANGAGKTTTLDCFLDFTRPTAGSAEVDGIVVAADPVAAKRRCALVPENVVAYATLTARQNLRFFSRLGGGDRSLAGDGADALERVGLPAAAFDRPVREFSKGMRQKLGIAVAIARDAPNLLLDEPTSGLDPAAAADFMALLAGLRADGRAILMCTHDVFRAREYADRAAVMRAGRLVAIVERDELRHCDLEALYLELMADDDEHGPRFPRPMSRVPLSP